MMNAWNELLAEPAPTTATVDIDAVDERAELSHSSWIAPLPSRAVLKVSGEDALEFLHGQFSNDLKQLADRQWQLSSYSTPKGRLLAVFRIARVDADFYIDMPQSTSEAFHKRLAMFVMRSKVRIESLAGNMLVSAIAGKDAPKALQGLGLTAPASVNSLSTSQTNDALVLSECGEVPRYVILASPERTRTLWQTADPSILRTTENTWSLSQIENGQPDVFDETKEQFVAQMMNLHVIGAVNFKKGCYPGQEVIARLKYLGKLKRRLYRFSVNCAKLPAPGAEVFVKGDSAAVGKVAAAAYRTPDSAEILAVMTIVSVQNDSVLQLADGELLTLLDLPYTVAE